MLHVRLSTRRQNRGGCMYPVCPQCIAKANQTPASKLAFVIWPFRECFFGTEVGIRHNMTHPVHVYKGQRMIQFQFPLRSALMPTFSVQVVPQHTELRKAMTWQPKKLYNRLSTLSTSLLPLTIHVSEKREAGLPTRRQYDFWEAILH